MYHISLLEEGETKIDLVGRRPFISVRERVVEEIASLPKGSVAYLDLNEVEEINGSGIHEVIYKPLKWLLENFKEHDKFLVLINLSEDHDHQYNINITLRNENVAIIAKDGASYQAIGEIGNARMEILDLVYSNKEITARDVVNSFDKKLTLASTHLTKLYETRLMNRREVQLEEGGRQFIYSSLF